MSLPRHFDSVTDAPSHKAWMHDPSLIPHNLSFDNFRPEPDLALYNTHRDFLNKGFAVTRRNPETSLLETRVRKCGHSFSMESLINWSITTRHCPTCRTELFKSYDNGQKDYFVNPTQDIAIVYLFDCQTITCGKSFRDSTDLTEHVRDTGHTMIFPRDNTLTVNKDDPCPQHQDVVIKCNDELHLHFGLQHTWNCPYCDKPCPGNDDNESATALRNHISCHQLRPITCPVCGVTFKDIDTYSSHKRPEYMYVAKLKHAWSQQPYDEGSPYAGLHNRRARILDRVHYQDSMLQGHLRAQGMHNIDNL